MKTLITICVAFTVISAASAQSTFGVQQSISTNADYAFSVYAADLDGDGDADALSASWYDDKIAWSENVGAGNGINGGCFAMEEIITTNADGARSVFAIDLDNDGDIDVLSASFGDHKIAWYENLGAGNGIAGGRFGAQQVISTLANDPTCVYAIDIDSDGDADVLSASYLDDKIAWYENLGGGSFGLQQVITISANGTYSVYATDIDGDGDPDVLSASRHDNKIAWYENVGAGNG
ncbi:MAG: VCBS repeat-containing protein, partial [Pirellulaceae bacterium]|nr:VCBS repeat-containing protein [Pirellulaceae bacterium]